MKKVYICRSNLSKTDYVAYVRERIQEFTSLEIIEHTGSNYDPNLINQADLVLVVPHTLPDFINDDDFFNVGKGQYNEISKTYQNLPVYTLLNLRDKLVFSCVNDTWIDDVTDYKRSYGAVEFDTEKFFDTEELFEELKCRTEKYPRTVGNSHVLSDINLENTSTSNNVDKRLLLTRKNKKS